MYSRQESITSQFHSRLEARVGGEFQILAQVGNTGKYDFLDVINFFKVAKNLTF
jgi:hypothetical protein